MQKSMINARKQRNVQHGKVNEYQRIFDLIEFEDLDMLIGFLAVSFINCSALGGAIILPFRKKPAFKWILTAFIGLGKI